MTTAQPTQTERFVGYLEGLAQRQDRGALAALRRGLGQEPGTIASMYPHVIPWAPAETWRQDPYFVIAALFSMHPQTGGRGSLGRAMRNIQGPDGGPAESVERRFTALLASHPEDLPTNLRQVVGLLRSNDVPVDWRQLMRDILGWGHPDRYVQRRWAQDFWSPI